MAISSPCVSRLAEFRKLKSTSAPGRADRQSLRTPVNCVCRHTYVCSEALTGRQSQLSDGSWRTSRESGVGPLMRSVKLTWKYVSPNASVGYREDVTSMPAVQLL